MAHLDEERMNVSALVNYLKEQGVNLDDEDLLLDTIEGETDALEAVSKVLRWIGFDNAKSDGIKGYIDDLTARKRRYDERVKANRQALAKFMAEFGLTKIERPEATLSYRQGSQSIGYAADFDATLLPTEMQKVSVEADKAKVKQAVLFDGQDLPGVYMTNGEPVLTVRVK